MKFVGKVGNGPMNSEILVAIRITVWIQGLFSGFVTTGRYGKCLTDINLLLILIRVRRALVEVCTFPVLLVVVIIDVP